VDNNINKQQSSTMSKKALRQQCLQNQPSEIKGWYDVTSLASSDDIVPMPSEKQYPSLSTSAISLYRTPSWSVIPTVSSDVEKH
jgi:hypothetical protein